MLGYGILVFLVLPRGVTVMNDDFGYLGSIIETLHHHRPWTDDWLEPWSASLATISAALYAISGSFQLATQGIQVICALAAFAGAYALCRAREIGSGASIVISILGLTHPTLLWKSIEYTAVALYIPCLLWAIWAAHRRHWGVFYLAWAIAFASRQSAITWLALPLLEVIQAWPSKKGKVALSPPALVLWGAIIAYVALSAGMNHTQSQRMITEHILDKVKFVTSFRNFSIAVSVYAVFSGLGALILKWRNDGLSTARNIPHRIIALLVLGVGLFTFVEHSPGLFAEHQIFEGWSGRMYTNITIAAGLAGWLLFRFTIRWELLVASIAAGLLVSLRREVWDYYYLDVAIFAFFSISLPRSKEPTEMLTHPPRVVGIVCALIFSAFHLWFVFEQKLRVDRDYAVCVTTEKALRANEIDVCDIGYAPYGFIGWQLHRHFVEHEGKEDPDIGGFMRYQRSGAAELRFSPMRFWRDSKSLSPLGGEIGQRVIRSEIFRVGWLWNQRVTILKPTSVEQIQPARLAFDRSRYHPRLFPLTNQEWRQHVRSTAR